MYDFSNSDFSISALQMSKMKMVEEMGRPNILNCLQI